MPLSQVTRRWTDLSLWMCQMIWQAFWQACSQYEHKIRARGTYIHIQLVNCFGKAAWNSFWNTLDIEYDKTNLKELSHVKYFVNVTVPAWQICTLYSSSMSHVLFLQVLVFWMNLIRQSWIFTLRWLGWNRQWDLSIYY